MEQQTFFELSELPISFDVEIWKSALREHASKDTSSQWALGDLLLVAEELLGLDENWNKRKAREFKQAAVKATGKSWGTLKNFKSTARNFPPSLRSDAVSYGVHRVIAAVTGKDRERLLAMAEKEGLTVDRMTTLVQRERKHGRLPAGRKPKEGQVVKVELTDDNYRTLEKMGYAKDLRRPLVENSILWIVAEYFREHKTEIRQEIIRHEEKEAAKVASTWDDDNDDEEEDLSGVPPEIRDKIPSY